MPKGAGDSSDAQAASLLFPLAFLEPQCSPAKQFRTPPFGRLNVVGIVGVPGFKPRLAVARRHAARMVNVTAGLTLILAI